MTQPTRILLSATLAMASAAASAQTPNPYYIGLSQTFTRESNLLRLNNGDATPAGLSKSDTVSSTALLAGFDQPFGRQRAYANLALRANRYQDNDSFNNQGYSAGAGLNWSTIERLSGTLTASTNRSLQQFGAVGPLTQKNLETVNAVSATAMLGTVTQYSFEVSAGHRTVRNSLDDPGVRSRDYSQDTVSAGIRWRPSTITSIGLGVTGGRGKSNFLTVDNANRIVVEEDRFDRRDIDLTATYAPTGSSSFDARISTGKTEYDRFNSRDYSGVTGTLGYAYNPGGKLRGSARYTRDTGQDSFLTTVANTTGTGSTSTTTFVPVQANNSRVTDSLRVQAEYDVTGKIGLVTALDYLDRDVAQSVPGGAGGATTVQNIPERITLFSLGARYAFLRNVLFGCDVSNERRRSGGARLSANAIGCYGQVTLQ